jgi:hypothetical protein
VPDVGKFMRIPNALEGSRIVENVHMLRACGYRTHYSGLTSRKLRAATILDT